jgi:hypothetical protein
MGFAIPHPLFFAGTVADVLTLRNRGRLPPVAIESKWCSHIFRQVMVDTVGVA